MTMVYSGLALTILSLMGKKFNFTHVNVSPKDGKWGAANADGTWNGKVGMLTREEVDVVPCGLTQVRVL
jgi:hypothetical protein